MTSITHLSSTGEPMAPAGFVFVCCACGKTSKGQWGTEAMPGWDASCTMNSVLAREVDLVRDISSGRVTQILK